MLEKKGIHASKSPWASPIVFVTKKNGDTRFCVDYRRLNSVMKRDVYPLPRIDDMLKSLSEALCWTLPQDFGKLRLICGATAKDKVRKAVGCCIC